MRFLLIGRGKMGRLIQETARSAGDEIEAAFGRDDLDQLGKLGRVADVVIDVKCVSGDAALSMDGLEPHFCGTSTVLGMGNALGGRIGAMVSGFVYGLELILFSGFTYSLFNHFAAVGAEGTGHDCIDAMALMTIMKNPVVGIIIIVGAFILASVLAVRYQKKVAEKSQAA